MREIKFRVWTDSKMEYNVMAGFLGVFYVAGMNEKDSACMSEFNTIYSKETPIMQYTGLKDKNGKEIYEGDRINFVDMEWNRIVEEVVTWRGDIYFWGLGKKLFDEADDMKVIGNIHESELKGKKNGKS